MLSEPGFKNRKVYPREPVRILLLEDDAHFAELLRMQLRRLPCVESRLDVVDTLTAALERLRTESYGLVLADLNLPDSSGLATVEGLSRGGGQLVIVLTGTEDPRMRVGALEAGAYDFLSKDHLSAASLERLVRLAAMQASTFRSLRESEQRFRSLTTLSSDFFWESDGQHRVVRTEHGEGMHPAVNPAQLGKARWDMPSTYPDAAGWAAFRAVMEAHMPFRDFEVARLDENGIERWRSISGEPVFDENGGFAGYRGVGSDITARKRAEEELRRFRLAMDGSGDMILLIDRSTMRHVDVNATACKLLGYTREELLSMGPADLLPVRREDLERTYDELIANPGRASGMNSHYRCKDGSHLPFESTRRALHSGSGWIIVAVSRDIRDRLAAEATLRETEARLHRTFDLAASGIAHVGRDGRFLWVNPRLCQMLGYSREELVGRSVKDISHPGDRDVTDAQRARLHAGETESASCEKRYLRKDGSVLWTSLAIAVARDAQGAPQYDIVVLDDITERKAREREIAQLGRMYAALGSANEAILRAKTPQEVFDRACAIAVDAGGFILATVFSLAADGKSLMCAAASGPAAEQMESITPSLDESHPGGRGLMGLAGRTGKPAISNDYEADERTQGRRHVKRSYPVGSAAVFPLRVEGALAGVLGLQHAEQGAFGAELIGLLQRLADSISFALDNFRREQSRGHAQSALRESEARFRSLTNLSSDFFWETDAAHRIVQSVHGPGHKPVNPLGSQQGKTRWELPSIYPDADGWAAHRATLDAHLPFRDFELARLTPDGVERHLSISGEPVFDEAGRFKGYRGMGKDITARKRDEQTRHMEHAITRLLAEAGATSDVLRDVLRTICEGQKWDCGRYFATHDDTQSLSLVEAWSIPGSGTEKFIEGTRAFTFTRGQGLSGHVWNSGEPVWVADITKDPRAMQAVFTIDSGMRGAFFVPVTSQGRVIGVLGFNARQVRQPDERILQAMRVIGSQIGQFLQRKRAEQERRDSEERFRRLTALSSDWYWEQDDEYRFTHIGGTGAGDRAGAHIGKRRWEVGLEVEGGWDAHRAVLDAHQPFRDVVMWRRLDDGSMRYVSVSGEPTFGGDGRFAGYRGIGRDITARKRTEELRDLEHTITRRLAETRSAADALRNAIRAVCESQHWECGRYFAWDEAAGVLRFGGSWHIPDRVFDVLIERSRDITYTPGTGLIGEAFQSGRPMWVRDMATDSRVKAGIARASGMHAALLLPIVSEGKPIGVLMLYSREVREHDQRLTESIHVIGSQIGQFLQRKRAEEEQMASRVLLDNIVDNIPTAVQVKAVREGAFPIVMWNKAAEAMYGVPREEAIGRTVHDLWPAENARAFHASDVALVARGGMDDYPDRPAMTRDRGLIRVHMRKVPLYDPSSKPTHLLVVADDITAKITDEARVRESEARFRSLTELSSDWYWEQDAEYRFTKFEGGRAGDARTVPTAAVLGKRPWELPGVVRGSIDWQAHRATLERREAFRKAEYAYQDRAGHVYYVSVDGEPVFDGAGRFAGYRGTSRDVTRLRRREDELRRFRAALDAAADMMFLVDMSDARLLDFNDTACRFLGYARDELLRQPSALILEDAPEAALKASYAMLMATQERADSLVRTYRRKDGSTFDAEVLRRVIDSREGPILVINARDLTERKAVEARQAGHLRRQERIARFGQSALGMRDPAELIDEAVQNVLEGLGADAVAFFEAGRDESSLSVRALAGLADPGGPAAVACGENDPVLGVMRSGGRLLVDGNGFSMPWARAMRSHALIPVRGARAVLCACRGAPDAFTDEDLNFIETVANVLSTGLQRIESEARLAYLAQFDPLTGLPNRALLADRFSQMIVQAQRHDRALGVLFIDLDEFKMVNDTLGHSGGDALLKEIAMRLQSTVRPGDTVARISGDEFAVVLADLARPEDAALVAQKVIDRLAAPVDVLGSQAFVTASVGIAAFPGDGHDAETLLGAADAAMYRAKQSGRNSYQFFTAEITQRTRARAQVGKELRRALEREEFALAYQPKFNLETRRPYGAEALLRWKHPERGTVSPADFIPVLEETGLIVQVGEWVLRRACADIKAWRAAGIDTGPIAVNLSARQFRQSDLDARIAGLLAESGVKAAAIELEITESQLMHDPEQAIRVMRALRKAGIRIAIDDFGTGYSSLSSLTRFPVAALKIDRSFVRDVYSDPSAAAIVRTIIEMAHTLGFQVVAEGVETEEQAGFLRLLRCELAQGYLFARPMPAAELGALVAAAADGSHKAV